MKTITLKEMKPKKIKSTSDDVIYIRNVPNDVAQKFNRLAAKLNMKRSELFKSLISNCVISDDIS